MKKTITTLLLGLTLCGATSYAQSTLSEQNVAMKTYDFSDPDPIANPQKAIYPYFRFDGFTPDATMKEWKMVELENPYIKVRIAPEVGGKVWGAVEKKSGRDFIYDNDVVKFRDIAMRGPWTSGGVEINFGIIGHAPWTATPVDYAVRENKDGSVSCFVGTLDLLTRAWWSCEIKLEKDKAYFTTTTKYYNPSALSSPYYHWMNAGYDLSDNMEYYFPGDGYIGHGGDAHSWTHDSEGRDLSKYAQNNFGSAKSYHIMGSTGDYYATYWPEHAYGSGHYAPYDEKLGMKIFLWGHSREGMIWEGLLTDNSGHYVELQSGRIFNQETRGSSHETPYKHYKHQGYATEGSTEYWYPIKDTRGVMTSNKYATINIEDGVLYISPLQALNETIEVKNNGETIYSGVVELQPMENYSQKLQGELSGEVEVVLGDNKLVYSKEYTQPTSRPRELPEGFDRNSTLYGRYLTAIQSVYVKEYDMAKALFEEVLAEDKYYAPALVGLGEVHFKQGDYNKAKELALKALALDTYNGEANILYGLSSAQLGQSTDAVDGYGVAALSVPHQSAAYVGLAKEFAKRGTWHSVVEYADKTLRTAAENGDAAQLRAVAQRKMGATEDALQTLGELEYLEPLNHYARFEKHLLGKATAQEFTSKVTNELAHETYLEMGLWYESLGQLEDALKLYSLAGEHPQILYRTAYVQHLLGQDFSAALQKATQASAELAFPFRHESLPAYSWATEVDDSWKNGYYLALLKWHLGDKPEALKLLEAAGNTPDFAPFYITRSMLKSSSDRIADLRKAETFGKNWRIGTMLIKEYKAQGLVDEMSAVAKEYSTLFGDDFRLGMAYVPVLIQNKEYEKALEYLETVQILPYEGANEGRTMYRDCNLYLALEAIEAGKYRQAIKSVEKSIPWIENLGVGQPYEEDIDKRTEKYIMAYCYEKMGQQRRATQLYTEVAESSAMQNSNTILSLLCLKKLGRTTEADELLAKYLEYNNNDVVAAWAEALYNGDTEEAERIIESGDTRSRVGAFGSNDFKDFGYITIVQEAVKL